MLKLFIKKITSHYQLTTGFVSLSILLLGFPGQNPLQTLELHPQAPKVRGIEIELPTPSDYPVPVDGIIYPKLSAQGVIVVDANSASILYEKNPDLKLMPASTTKIMTALVAMDVYQLDEIVTINNANQSIGHKSDLVSGEQITVENLLYAMLVSSGNDAALALAQYYPLGYQVFINLMNQKAIDLNLTNTQYQNVSGVEQYGHYTTVRDLSLLTKEAMKNSLFSQIVATKTKTITSLDGQITHRLENINELLGQVEGIQGVKTGWTEHAGECLVTYTVRDNHPIIVVVLNSLDRFGESQTLIDWAYTNHTWISPSIN